ncbi:hypothetical protein HPB51_003883 [Rhipicephalus microplus]|uniref:Xrn1 helical domain-containing protein n=1 Tax=Rhipicephalus microplus TaxID=6941 RepID=A0A9J6EEX8_RHIMP|nr:hypothetical protein HPB51_003883 [Rhipicephalus microplus]
MSVSQSAQSFLSGLLEKFSHLDIHDFDSDEDQEGFLEMEFHQRKRDYYVNKLENSDVNKQVMQEQAHVWAIQWNLHYYYNGVQSWKWFYLHNYSPYISDIKYFQNLYMTFELGKPFLPFQQHKPFFLQPVKSWCPSPSSHTAIGFMADPWWWVEPTWVQQTNQPIPKSGYVPYSDDHHSSRVHVAKCCNSAGAPCCHRWNEPWMRLFRRAESDRHLETSVMQAALTVKRTQHKAAFV